MVILVHSSSSRKPCGKCQDKPAWGQKVEEPEKVVGWAGMRDRISDRTRGRILKVHQGFRLEIWKNFSMERIIKHWNRQPTAVVEPQSLEEAFEERRDVRHGLAQRVVLGHRLDTAISEIFSNLTASAKGGGPGEQWGAAGKGTWALGGRVLAGPAQDHIHPTRWRWGQAGAGTETRKEGGEAAPEEGGAAAAGRARRGYRGNGVGRARAARTRRAPLPARPCRGKRCAASCSWSSTRWVLGPRSPPASAGPRPAGEAALGSSGSASRPASLGRPPPAIPARRSFWVAAPGPAAERGRAPSSIASPVCSPRRGVGSSRAPPQLPFPVANLWGMFVPVPPPFRWC